MTIKEGKDPKLMEWSVPSLPKFSTKKGPLDFIEKLWKSEKRKVNATLAVCPNDKLIDIGPRVVDLYRYLKTDLYDNWKKRTVAPDDYKDRYFCYAQNSKFLPKARHFAHFSEDISPEGIAKDL